MDDAISRQTVLTMLDDIEDEVMDGEGYQYGKWSEYVEQLPAAQRMRGKWIPHKSKFGGEDEKVYTCDQCGHNIGFHAENFCPNCGADMREKE